MGGRERASCRRKGEAETPCQSLLQCGTQVYGRRHQVPCKGGVIEHPTHESIAARTFESQRDHNAGMQPRMHTRSMVIARGRNPWTHCGVSEHRLEEEQTV